MGRRRRGRAVNGVLVLDKPAGMTSNGALQQAKRLFGAAKAGHTGSLDPLATGVLPLCFGEATKFSQFVLDADKAYDCTACLGVGTDTLDADGTVVASACAQHITPAALQAAVEAHIGEIEQLPPMYSALKHNGQPLYKLARAGQEVERKRRTITISRLLIQDFEPGTEAAVTLSVECSKGTYIRSLVESLGNALGVPAHVTGLRRTKAGPYGLEGSIRLDALEAMAPEGVERLDSLLLPLDGPLEQLPAVTLGESATFYLRQGQAVLVPNAPQSGKVRAYAESGLFLGIGEMLDDGRLAPRRVVVH